MLGTRSGNQLVKWDGSLTPVDASLRDDQLVNFHAPIFNVKDYGATGGGIRDDRAAINAALAAVPATGGVVYLPTGTYALSGSLTVAKNGTYIRGDGRDLTILTPTVTTFGATYPGVISSWGLSQITVTDLWIKGAVATPASTWSLPNDANGKGFFFSDITAPGGSTHNVANDIRVSRCRVSNVAGEAFYISHGGSNASNVVEFSDNECLTCASNTFNVNSGLQCLTAIIRNNRIDSCSGGIQAYSKNLYINNNTIRDTLHHGADLILVESPHFDVSHNLIVGADMSTASTSAINVISLNSENQAGSVCNNVIADCFQIGVNANQQAAIHVDAIAGPIRVTGNTFYSINSNGNGNGCAAVSVGATYLTSTTDVLIDNNAIYTGGPSTNLTHGIRLYAAIGSNKIRILNNGNYVATPKEYNGVTPLLDA